MRTNDKQRQEVTLERRICDRCKDVDGLTFGYIGNFERWGDDRKLFIWINEDDMRAKNGNQASLWECEARDLNVKDAYAAFAAIQGFQMGKLYSSIKINKKL
jgi:hypothetical protein|tara:strand:- start:240 stop:545 length:306 start_codon:yes stop_codon:yes gene_type:complete